MANPKRKNFLYLLLDDYFLETRIPEEQTHFLGMKDLCERDPAVALQYKEYLEQLQKDAIVMRILVTFCKEPSSINNYHLNTLEMCQKQMEREIKGIEKQLDDKLINDSEGRDLLREAISLNNAIGTSIVNQSYVMII